MYSIVIWRVRLCIGALSSWPTLGERGVGKADTAPQRLLGFLAEAPFQRWLRQGRHMSLAVAYFRATEIDCTNVADHA